jgi:thiol-disulfide isomerase/thioredoxin
MTGLWALLGTLVAVGAIGLVLRAREGRIKAAKNEPSRLPGPVLDLLEADAPVTLVQLSTTFCAPCRHARTVLTDLAARTDGLRHVELDITDLPEVASGLGVLRTPTTIALDRSGVELLRVGGVPKRDTLIEALRPHLPATNG